MAVFGKRVGGGRRSASRETFGLPAVLSTVEDYQIAMILDLSSSGARLKGHDLPPQGQAIAIKLDCVRTFGVVAWSTDDECGVAFDQHLARFELDRLRREVKLAAIAWTTLEEKLASDDWLMGKAR